MPDPAHSLSGPRWQPPRSATLAAIKICRFGGSALGRGPPLAVLPWRPWGGDAILTSSTACMHALSTTTDHRPRVSRARTACCATRKEPCHGRQSHGEPGTREPACAVHMRAWFQLVAGAPADASMLCSLHAFVPHCALRQCMSHMHAWNSGTWGPSVVRHEISYERDERDECDECDECAPRVPYTPRCAWELWYSGKVP